MTRLQVELDDFVGAARVLDGRVADPVLTAVARLSSALDAGGGMAGDDPAGRSWAQSYDTAARTVLGATHRVSAAAYATSAMFGRSALNYARAEIASTSGGSHPDAATLVRGLPTAPVPVTLASLPGAAGGGGGEPTGWGVIKDLVGYVWPNGHQDRLRDAASAYRRCAAAIEAVALEPVLACGPFACDRLPEADDVITVCRGLSDRLDELALAHRALGDACSDLAHRLDECHSEVESELSELGIESGVIQGVGAAISIVTVGVAEVPTQAVQAARIAGVATRVGQLIAKFLEAARTLAGTVFEISAAAERIAQALDGLADARLAYAGVTGVPRAARAAAVAMHSREVASTGRLAKEATDGFPARLTGRRFGDPGIWKTPKSLRRHFRIHGHEFGCKTAEEYSQQASDLLQRALHHKLPTKIDPKDGTIRVWDPSTGAFGSFRSDGATFTYFKPDHPAKYFAEQPGG